MAGGYVSIDVFKKLETKVNKLLVIHELDAMLTPAEKKLLDEAKGDIRKRKMGSFVSIGRL